MGTTAASASGSSRPASAVRYVESISSQAGVKIPAYASDSARALVQMLNAIGHIALVVKDPARTAALFGSLFNARIVQRNDAEGHHETFVRLGTTWFVLVGAEVERPRTGDHIAFHVTQDVLESVADKLRAMSVEFIRARSDTALYFFDYDNHVFELDIADMDTELQST